MKRFSIAMALGLIAIGASSCQLLVSFEQVPETGEQCMDGIDNDGNGKTDCADPSCAGAPACMHVVAVCGNGVVEGSEQCDDGNTVNGDGCEADCTLPRCGNGILDRPVIALATPPTAVIPVAGKPTYLAQTDLVATDGKVEVLVGVANATNSSQLVVLHRSGNGPFNADTPIPMTITLSGMAVGLFNSSTGPAPVVIDGPTGMLTVFENMAGSLSALVTLSAGKQLGGVTTADLFNKQLDDIAVGESSIPEIFVFQNNGIG